MFKKRKHPAPYKQTVPLKNVDGTYLADLYVGDRELKVVPKPNLRGDRLGKTGVRYEYPMHILFMKFGARAHQEQSTIVA